MSSLLDALEVSTHIRVNKWVQPLEFALCYELRRYSHTYDASGLARVHMRNLLHAHYGERK